jgi:hypothetical protein
MGLTYVPVIQNGTPIDTTTVTADDVTVSDTLTATTAHVTGNETVDGTLTVTGQATLNGGLSVFGTTSLGTTHMGAADATQQTVTTTGGSVVGVGVKTTGDAQNRTAILGNGTIQFSDGTAAADATIARTGVNALQADTFFRVKTGQSDGDYSVFGNLKIGTVGTGIQVKQGANATFGTVTLVTGSATVNTTKVTANSVIFLTVQSLGTVTSPKAMCVFNKTAGTSFQIASSDATDTSVVGWWIVEPA